MTVLPVGLGAIGVGSVAVKKAQVQAKWLISVYTVAAHGDSGLAKISFEVFADATPKIKVLTINKKYFACRFMFVPPTKPIALE